MAEFEGQITAIGPVISAGYAENELAELYFECFIKGERSWHDPDTYRVSYDVHIEDQRIITDRTLAYLLFGWIWETYKEWELAETVALMPMPGRDIHGELVLKDFERNVMDRAGFVIPCKDKPGVPSPSQWPWKEIALGLGAGALVGAIVLRRLR